MARQNSRYYVMEATAPEIAEEIGRLAKEAAEGNSAARSNLRTLRAMWQDMNAKGMRSAKEWQAQQTAEVESKLNQQGLSLDPSKSSTQATTVAPAIAIPSMMRTPPPAAPKPEILKGAPSRPQPELLKGAPKKSAYIPNQSRYSDRVMQYMPVIKEAAQKYNVPEELMVRMITQESGGQVGAVSSKGARGIAQFIGSTAKRYGVDVNDPNSSIFGMAHYLRNNYDKLGTWEKATAAYNHGENDSAYNLPNWKTKMPGETKGYINNISPEDFDNPGYTSPPLGQDQAQQLGVTPYATPVNHNLGQPKEVYTPTAAPQWDPSAVAQTAPATQPTVSKVGDAPAPPPTETPEQRAERLKQGLEIWKQQQKYAAEQERKNALPPGYGDMSHMKAGMAGMANPGYEDMSGQGQAGMMNLMQMLRMFGGSNGGR